ncbi:MAG: DUF4386 family protein [Betaproteobacteria bacterium]
MHTPIDEPTRLRYARLAGGLYLLLLAMFIAGLALADRALGDGGFAEAARSVAAQPAVYRFGLLLQLLHAVLTVLLAVALYVLLQPVDALLAQQAMIWRLAEAAVGAVAIVIAFGRPALYVAAAEAGSLTAAQGAAVTAMVRAMSDSGLQVSALLASVGSFLFYGLFGRTNLLPRWLSGLGVIASVVAAFVAVALLLWPDASFVEVGWLPIVVAETLTGLWLLAARGDAGAQPAAAPVAPVRAVSNKRRYATRFAVALIGGVPFALLISIQSPVPLSIWFVRVWFVSFAAVLAYSLCERWPARLPPWQARWVYTLLGVVAVIPLAAYAGYWVTTGEFAFWQNQSKRLEGFLSLTFAGVLFAPWIALAAMVRTREALAHEQALAFALERSQLERQALDARLRLLQAQVQPHFLLNTLANVRALVGAGSPQAPAVLDSLIAYLRAAVPKLDAPAATVGDELKLVRAYLELMQLRMPDRLRYAIDAEPAAHAVACPPLTLLTLVENAVRHGIDPGERGGAIEVAARVRDGRCTLRVVDTGVGLSPGGGSAGTGLANLRERLQLTYGDGAALRLTEIAPNGVAAEVEFPVQPPPR